MASSFGSHKRSDSSSSLKKSNSFSDFSSIVGVEDGGGGGGAGGGGEKKEDTGGCSRGIHHWLVNIYGKEDTATVEKLCKIFVEDFGYSGGLDDLQGLNDEEITEVINSMEKFGVKLRTRQRLRRALYEQVEVKKEKGVGGREGGGEEDGEGDMDYKFFSKLGEKKRLLPGEAQ